MGSCCRRAKALSAPTSFCGTLAMATPVMFQDQGSGVEPTILVGGGRMSLATALSNFSCSSTPTVGVRLAELLVRATSTAQKKNPVKLKELAGRGMALLSAKDAVFSILDKCGFCKGIGCSTCNNEGFTR
jgi:hypothetical protein